MSLSAARDQRPAAFDIESRDGDLNYIEIPVEVEAGDLLYAAKGYDSSDVQQDRNVQIPIDRLREYESSLVIGSLNSVWWSVSSYIPNAARVADELAPALAERLHRYQVQCALLIPRQGLSPDARHCRQGDRAQRDTYMMLSVDPKITDTVRPPRTAYYVGNFGSVAGLPNRPEYQMRILDEALRWTETFDQPGSKKLSVKMQTEVQESRGEQ